jgi:hypothetical protein
MSALESLLARANQLASKVDFWNSAVLWALLITALAAGAIVFSQRLAFVRARQLSEVRDEIGKIKEASATDRADKLDQANTKLRTDLETEKGKVAGLQDAASIQQERAAKAEKELLELREKFKPRILTATQQVRISERLRPYTGKYFDVALHVEPETQDLLIAIEDALKAAGWIEIDWKSGQSMAEINFVRTGKPIAGIVSLTGVVIQSHPENVPESAAASRALASALNAEGIAAEPQFGLGVANANSKAIHVLIGKKPQ